METSSNNTLFIRRILPMLMIAAAYVAGMFTDIMEIDAAQYASMARHVLEQENPLIFFDRGHPYLDKPPLIFWLTALSFKVFGISNFTYRLPSLLFSFLAIYSIYGFAKLYYKERTAFIAALVTASCQAFFVMNQDVKTDMYLIGSVTLALWQLGAFMQTEKWKHLILGFVGVGLGLLSKGPLGVVLPGLAIGFHLVLTRNWRMLFNWKWLLGLPVAGVLLIPMCIGLYQQHGNEGLEFFFWTQSFGRVTGDSSWKNNTTPFFLLHSFLWAFLPWTLIFVVAFFSKGVEIVRNRFRLMEEEEGLALGAFLLGGLSLSSSNFILPHYAFVLVPFAGVILAEQMEKWADLSWGKKLDNVFKWVHLVIGALVILVLPALLFWAFHPNLIVSILLFGIVLGAFVFYIARFFKIKGKVWLPVLMAMAGANFVVNALLYPQLLQYQSAGQAAKFILKEEIPLEHVYGYGDVGRSMDVYLEKDMELMEGNGPTAKYIEHDEIYIYATPDAKEALEGQFKVEMIREFDHIHVGRLSLPFIIPNSREKVTGKRYLLHIPQKDQ